MNGKRIRRLLGGVLVGLVAVAGLLWGLSRSLSNSPPDPKLAGHTLSYWQEQLRSHEAARSNAAFAALRARVVPQLVATMLHDTQDSQAQVWLVSQLNTLPGMQVDFLEAWGRRVRAACLLGELGPAAETAVPDLIEVVRGPDQRVKRAAIEALGKLHVEPDTVIPLLIGCLEDDALDVSAARALGGFGPRAKAAVPRLLPLLHAAELDDRAAAEAALRSIDPEAAEQSPHLDNPAGKP